MAHRNTSLIEKLAVDLAVAAGIPESAVFVFSQSIWADIAGLASDARAMALRQVQHHRAVTDGASLYEHYCAECLRAWTDDIAPKHSESCSVGNVLALAAKVLSVQEIAIAKPSDASDKAPVERHIEYSDNGYCLGLRDADRIEPVAGARLTHEQATALSARFVERVQL